MKKIKLVSVAVAALLAVAPAVTTVSNGNVTTVQAAVHHKRGKKSVRRVRRHTKKHVKRVRGRKHVKRVRGRKHAKRAKRSKKIDWKHTPYGDLTDLPMKDRLKVMNGTESAGYLRTIAKNNRNLDYTGPNANVVNYDDPDGYYSQDLGPTQEEIDDHNSAVANSIVNDNTDDGVTVY